MVFQFDADLFPDPLLGTKVIKHVDSVLTSTNVSAQTELKVTLSLTNLTHLDDVAGVRELKFPSLMSSSTRPHTFLILVVYPLWQWQSLQPNSPRQSFYDFCDALEYQNNITAPESGVGLSSALKGMGEYLRTYLGNCKPFHLPL